MKSIVIALLLLAAMLSHAATNGVALRMKRIAVPEPVLPLSSLKISLGIRNIFTSVPYPLAFRMENIGKTAIAGGSIRGIYRNAIIHLLPKGGTEQTFEFKRDGLQGYGLVPNDLQPGNTYDHGYVGNILTFFPSAKDGVYQVWWTLGDLKSNVLQFTVADGKVSDK